MSQRHCLTCSAMIASGSYCTACQRRDRGDEWRRVTVPTILSRDQHACTLCQRPCPHVAKPGAGHHHVDHITPRAVGGSSDPANLRTVCRAFNLSGKCK